MTIYLLIFKSYVEIAVKPQDMLLARRRELDGRWVGAERISYPA
jgi:hypothetical protein